MKFTRFLLIILCLSMVTCKSMKDKTTDKNYKSGSWAKVDSLSQKGLYQSAWDEVDVLSQKAITEDDLVDQIKTLFHQLRYSQMIEENSELKGIEKLEERIKTASEPVKSILHGICAQQYWGYYQNKRHQIYNRTEVSGTIPDDVELWSAGNFLDKINSHFEQSIAKKSNLENHLLKDIDERFFTDQYENFEVASKSMMRHSLYDLLAQQALAFYSNSEAGITRTADYFVIDNEVYFSPSDEFQNIDFPADNSDSFDYQTVSIYQDLLMYYSENSLSDALLDTDLKRLKWTNGKCTLTNKKELMSTALNTLATKDTKSIITAEIQYEKAVMLSADAGLYDPMLDDETNRWKNKDAIKLCDEIIAMYPETRGADLSKNLRSNIRNSNLGLSIEQMMIPNVSSLMRLNYKNENKVYCRLIKAEWSHKYSRKEQAERFKDLFKMDLEKEWTVDLKNAEDYQSHSTEIILPALESGYYGILVSSEPTFMSGTSMAYTKFWASHMGINSQNDKGESKFRVINRLDGEPMEDVSIEQFEVTENRRGGEERKLNKLETYNTDRDGEFETINYEGYRQYYLKFKWKGEEVIIPHNFNGRYQENNRETYQTHFFIDRGIYRPGQKIHFKAIVLKRKNKEVEVAKNYPASIVLHDANYQEVTKLILTTNEFGTANGVFTLPDNGLTGQMSLQHQNGSIYFSVEEYKRPKFEVQIDPVQGSFKLGENVSVEGSAIAFSGANIQDAEVKYSIYRSPQIKYFNWWYRCYIPPYAHSENVKIKDGVLDTDKDGKFAVGFVAIDGGDAGEAWLDYYNYEVRFTVTDVNGETQENKTNISVGKQALVLGLGISESVNLKAAKDVPIQTNNLGGEEIPSEGKLTLFKLIGPDEVKVDRYWEVTDQLNYSKADLFNKMPFMSFPGDMNKSNWERTKIKELNFNTAESKDMPSDFFTQLKDGEYVVKMEAKDAYGTLVEKEIFFKGYDVDSRNSYSYEPFEIIETKSSYKPGEDLTLLLNTSFDNLKLKIDVEHDERIIKEEYMMVTKGKKTYSLPIKSKYQGGFTIHFSGYKNNRYFSESVAINVPRIDKQLSVSLETFRDKMLPGSQEEWKLKVKAENGEKTLSEVLLNMYDASLDQFASNNRYFNPYQNHYAKMKWRNYLGSQINGESLYRYNTTLPVRSRYYQMLNMYEYSVYGDGYGMLTNGRHLSSMISSNNKSRSATSMGGVELMDEDMTEPEMSMEIAEVDLERKAPPPGATDKTEKTNGSPSPRTNFNETAFFYPDLMTDADGNLVFRFTLPESLTSWKFQALAISKSLQFGSMEAEMISQKDLMVVPNLPRFFRHGDKITLSSKVVNLSEDKLNGVAGIKLFDAFTMEDVTKEFINGSNEINISMDSKGQDLVSWDLNVGDRFDAITWRIYAKTEAHNDAEENAVPVLSNRSLVTETLPFALTNKKELTLSFDKLKNNNSSTLKNHSLTLEYNGNPVWYAIQAMPYMMEYPHDCAEQIFTRYYANALSSHVMNKKPQISKVIKQWQQFTPDSFLSKLEKNQELKSIVLEESPWVMSAQDETERKKRVALLLDINHMASKRNKASLQLKESQLGSGAWPWFKGMKPNLYITQHIISGFGHMDKLGIERLPNEEQMVMKGLDYLDRDHLRRYRERKKVGWDKKVNHTGSFEIQYLYARSFFIDQNFRADREAYSYYSEQIKEYWTTYNTYMKGMVALILHRQGDHETAQDILKSLLETSISSEEMGIYWKNDIYSWNWYEPTTERHALLIEAFSEINQDKNSVNLLKTWLIMNKRTNDWKTTKATAEACYALLLQGDDWTEKTEFKITIGSEKINSTDPKLKLEAGTGYFKKVWQEDDVNKSMADIQINKTGDSPSWGSVYWQYFEDLDKTTSAGGPLNISKEMYVVTETNEGEKLVPVTSENLKIGDRIRVRLNVVTDRNMEYVHIKDQRASAFEPIDVLSQYKYQGGMGYYQSTRDAGTHFFIDYLRKGTYTLDYDLFVSHAGDLSNGFALIECMYAPEFASHSEGIRINVAK